VVPLGDTDEHERRDGAGELERDDTVDLPLAQASRSASMSIT